MATGHRVNRTSDEHRKAQKAVYMADYRKRAKTFMGEACNQCGGRERYKSSGECKPCANAKNAARLAAERQRKREAAPAENYQRPAVFPLGWGWKP